MELRKALRNTLRTSIKVGKNYKPYRKIKTIFYLASSEGLSSPTQSHQSFQYF